MIAEIGRARESASARARERKIETGTRRKTETKRETGAGKGTGSEGETAGASVRGIDHGTGNARAMASEIGPGRGSASGTSRGARVRTPGGGHGATRRHGPRPAAGEAARRGMEGQALLEVEVKMARTRARWRVGTRTERRRPPRAAARIEKVTKTRATRRCRSSSPAPPPVAQHPPPPPPPPPRALSFQTSTCLRTRARTISSRQLLTSQEVPRSRGLRLAPGGQRLPPTPGPAKSRDAPAPAATLVVPDAHGVVSLVCMVLGLSRAPLHMHVQAALTAAGPLRTHVGQQRAPQGASPLGEGCLNALAGLPMHSSGPLLVCECFNEEEICVKCWNCLAPNLSWSSSSRSFVYGASS